MHNKKIKIPDQNLELEIRKLINHPTGEINEELLLPIKECKFDSVKIKDLDGWGNLSVSNLKFSIESKREINFDEQAYSFLTTDYIQTNIESKSKYAIHRLDVPETRTLDGNLKSETYGAELLNPHYKIDNKKSSPKKSIKVVGGAHTFLPSKYRE